MPATKPLRALMASWRQLCPATGPQEKDTARELRLRYCARVLGRPVSSCAELPERDLQQIAAAMQRELRDREGSAGTLARGSSSARPGNLRQFPNRNVAAKRMIWKIHQLESYLGWNGTPERLAGFLRQIFKQDRPERLTHAQSWRAVEALFAVAARALLKAAHGAAYQVSKNELAREVSRLKTVLSSWQPPAANLAESDAARFAELKKAERRRVLAAATGGE